MDLAFALYTSVFTGQLSGLAGSIAPLRVELRDVTTGQRVDAQRFEPTSDGSFMVSFNAPDGTYDLFITGGPSVGSRVDGVVLASGEVTSLGVVPFPLGDADFSGQVNFGDLNAVLGNWLATGPTP